LILKTCLLHVCMPLDHCKIGATPKGTTACKVHGGWAASYVSPRTRNLSKSSVNSRKHHYKSKTVRHFEASPSVIVPSSVAGEFAGCLTFYAGHTRGLAILAGWPLVAGLLSYITWRLLSVIISIVVVPHVARREELSFRPYLRYVDAASPANPKIRTNSSEIIQIEKESYGTWWIFMPDDPSFLRFSVHRGHSNMFLRQHEVLRRQRNHQRDLGLAPIRATGPATDCSPLPR
jgi:hypothetical protein